MLEAVNLTCVRDERVLFETLSFTLQAGDMLHVEGANGAGKTSLLRILAGLSAPEQGAIHWQQQPITHQRAQWHQDLLWLGHQPGIKAVLTAEENVAFYHPSVGEEAIWRALEAVDLAGYETVCVGQLSAGQQRRVALARLWLSQARVWVLDEPFTAIDKRGVANLMAQMEHHCQRGGILVVTTHQDFPAHVANLRKLTLDAVEPRP
ncbi:heme ABC transporter ATP-binding protein CcmA [Enterobacterales bacterium CwR94]|nr:heme ABC transporter ATP-binding protein CcmA [Enterobacterales bacterium CwR94]